MDRITPAFLLFIVIVLLHPPVTAAFGAGDIPDFAYLNGKAFRHGDIEDVLTELAKSAGHVAGGVGLLSIAHSALREGHRKFSKEDVKKVYFGNWLRDYSQAMDVAGLSKLSADTLVLIVAVLGFLTFGFATEEFQVTPDRLGVYLPVEHIDNPKGYAENEGDARRIHPKLRPPVNPRELEVDPATGMKNYMATENRGWDTSTAHIRRVFRKCIQHGRRAQGRECDHLWEAYRLLGTGLHTLEDLLAHSNWCELALRKMGYDEIFCHVGDEVIIETPSGPAPPLVTGTFGSADFLHSLMGEATDNISQTSVADLYTKLNDASQADNDSSSIVRLQAIFRKLPLGIGSSSRMDEANSLHADSKAYRFDPNNIAPPEVQAKLWQLMTWRDDIHKEVIKGIEMIPGLESMVDAMSDALNTFVYTVLAPYLTPILHEVTSILDEGSTAVIDTDDQYEVFNNPYASDPSHSLLSKDHFALILNEPAGKVAQLVVQYSTKLIVEAWYDPKINPDHVIGQILEAFHHPYYASERSHIQQEMFAGIVAWLDSLEPENIQRTLDALTKDGVREGNNKREDDMESSSQPHFQTEYEQEEGFGLPGADSGYGSSEFYSAFSDGEGKFGRGQGQYDDESRNSVRGGDTRRSTYEIPEIEGAIDPYPEEYNNRTGYVEDHRRTGGLYRPEYELNEAFEEDAPWDRPARTVAPAVLEEGDEFAEVFGSRAGLIDGGLDKYDAGRGSYKDASFEQAWDRKNEGEYDVGPGFDGISSQQPGALRNYRSGRGILGEADTEESYSVDEYSSSSSGGIGQAKSYVLSDDDEAQQAWDEESQRKTYIYTSEGGYGPPREENWGDNLGYMKGGSEQALSLQGFSVEEDSGGHYGHRSYVYPRSDY